MSILHDSPSLVLVLCYNIHKMHKMKKLLLLIGLLTALSGMSWGYEQKSAAVPSNPPSATSNARPSGVLKTCLKTIIVSDYYPYTFINEKGFPDGFSVDLMKAVTAVMGMEIDIKVGPWDAASKSLRDGQIDLLPMMAHSKEREKLFDFSVPHRYDAVFTRKGSQEILSVGNLRGKTIIVMDKDAPYQLRTIEPLIPCLQRLT